MMKKVPNISIEIDTETARKVFKLIDALEDSDDVQNVFANYSVSPETQAERLFVRDARASSARPLNRRLGPLHPRGIGHLAPPPAKPREVFAFVISGAKVRNPLAARALIERVGQGG